MIAPLHEAAVKQHIASVFKRSMMPKATGPKLAGGMSQKALGRLMLARIPGLKSATLVPSAGTLQSLLRPPHEAPKDDIGAGMHGPLGGNILTRTKGGGVSLKP